MAKLTKVERSWAQLRKETKRAYQRLVDSNQAIFYPNLVNPVKINGDTTTIYCYRKDEIIETYIDTEDLDKIAISYAISIVEKGGLYARVGGILESVHRVVMDYPENMVVDHINHNGLDNRKSNLRIITQEENLVYKKRPKDNKTGRKNISYKDGYYQLNISRTFISKETAEEALDKINKIIQHYSAIDAREKAEARLNGTEN